jgi:hypothetical protein
MKKIALVLFACFMAHLTYSQHASISVPLRNLTAKREVNKAISDIPEIKMPIDPMRGQHLLDPNETIVGTTFFDNQSNSALSNRISRHPDGTIGGVWTMGMNPTSFTDRGTGYNFFDGSEWGPAPTARIESIKCGWPSYDTWGPNGEINVSHNGTTGLQINKRQNRGSGAWTESLYLGPTGISETWPRLVTSGSNHEYIHMVYNTNAAYNGQDLAMLYSRSNDGGVTWNPQNVVLEGTGSSFYKEIAGDDYTMAARGNTVAILVSSAWRDLFVMKSTDNGATWNKIIIWNHPYPMFDWDNTITEMFFCVDESASVAIAPDGKVHVVFGINRVMHDVLGNVYTYSPFVDGIGYWNEDMPAFSDDIDALAPPSFGLASSEMVENYNYIGWTQDMDGDGEITFVETPSGFPMTYSSIGISTMPTISIDDNGNIFTAWASTTETYDNFTYNYKKIWVRAFSSGSWGDFYHATASIYHLFDESIFPVLAQSSDENIYLVYQADAYPGLAVNADHDYVENWITVSAIPKSDLIVITNPEINVDPVSMTIDEGTNDILTISNLGPDVLTVSSVSVSEPWIMVSGGPATPFNIDPGGSQDLLVEIDWDQLGDVPETGNIEIQSNDQDEPLVSVPVTAVPLGMPDLTIQNLNVDPSNVEPGGSLFASCEVLNQGTSGAGGSNLKYYLSDNPTFEIDDLELASDGVDSLGSGQSSNQDASLFIPENTAAGTWFILFYADADLQVAESTEDNNVAGYQVEVQSVWPDLLVLNQEIDTTLILPGGSLNALCDVMNQGTGLAGNNHLRYYLSEDNIYDDYDFELGSEEIELLDTGKFSTLSENLVIPANTSAGYWFILFFADADHQVDESDETNNLNFSQFIVDTTSNLGPEPDLPGHIVKAYPNPARDQLFVDFSGINEKPLSIELLNPLGSSMSILVNSGTHKGIISIDVTEFISGIYLLRIRFEKETVYKRILISD